MLEELMKCTTIDDFTLIGSKLLNDEMLSDLLDQIAQNRWIFRVEDYWIQSKLDVSSVADLAKEAKSEKDQIKALHMLQILQHCCPAVEVTIANLLKKTTV